MKDVKILFVYNSFETFVKTDLKILESEYNVTPLRASKFIVKFAIETFVKVVENDLVFMWFAGWHSLIPLIISKIFGKKTIIIAGGYDCVFIPEINYGVYASRFKRAITNFIIKNADSPYLIGERDKLWTKIKPQTYDMDGVLIGGQYGTGKRAGMISRVFVAFPDAESDSYESLGVAVGSGMSEDLMKTLKKLFDEEGVTECPFNVKIESDLSTQVNMWIYPEKGPVLEGRIMTMTVIPK